MVSAERVREVLDPLSVRRLPGLGRKTGAKVEEAGIRTFGELRSAPGCGAVAAVRPLRRRMRERASGIDDRPVLAEVDDKSLSAEDTFEEDIGEPRTLQRQLARLADLAREPAAQARLMAGCIGVKIRRGDFTTFTRQRAVARRRPRRARHRRGGRGAAEPLARRQPRGETSAAGGGLD